MRPRGHTDAVPAPRDVHLVVPTTGERSSLLDVCVASLLGQTVRPRITVVTRGSAEGLRGRWGPDVEVAQQERPGLSAAINGAWEADGWSSELTGWLGDDDALPPTSIADAVGELELHPAASMVHGRCLVIDQEGAPLRLLRNDAWAARLAGRGLNLLAQPGSLMRTSAVRTVGGLDEQLRLAMDVDLFLRLQEVGPIVTCRRQLGVFREHATSLSTAGSAAAAAEARVVRQRRQTTAAARWADRAAVPLTRVVSRITVRLPPRPESCWRPPTR
jgi:GT2 family glycosyltransferase